MPLLLTKLLSRKFLVALVTIIGALLDASLDTAHLAVAGGAAIAYVIAEAFVDRKRLDSLIEAAKSGVDQAKTTLAVLLIAGLAMTSAACGGTQSGASIARYTALGGALAATAVDPIIASAYERATEQFEAGQLSRDDFEVKLRRLDRADRALKSLTQALYAVDLAVFAAEAGHQCGLEPALGAAVHAAVRVLNALVEAGIDPPPELEAASTVVSVFVPAPECEAAAL